MLALLGFLTVVAVLAAIMSKRVSPLVALILVPTVAALAGEAGLSRAPFARRFTTLLGQPPLTYLTCSAGALRHPRHYAAGSPPERVA